MKIKDTMKAVKGIQESKKKNKGQQKVILEFYTEIWYCYDYENGSMNNPLFTSTSYELADAEAIDTGYEVVQVIDFDDEEETDPEPTPVNEGQPVQGEGFTPGEWYIGIDRETPGLTKYFFDRNGDETEEEAKANAVLIASAPTLLKENEQLKEQVRILESNGNTKNEIITNLGEQVRVLREALREALEDAESGVVTQATKNKAIRILSQTETK